MRSRSPSLSELHAFVAVIESGGFSRAADRLSLTQGAISRSVQRLEDQLGRALFVRHSTGVLPTAWAQQYYEKVQPALIALEEALPDHPQGPSQGRLRLSILPSLNMRWLVPRLAQFHALHPGIQIDFKPYSSSDDFQREDVDVWIQTRASSSSRFPRHVHATYLLGKEIVLVCHPRRADSLREASDVLAHPLLHHTAFPGNWAMWAQAHGIGNRGLRLGAGFELAAGLVEAAVADLGVAVVQACLVEREVAEGRLALPLPGLVSTGRGYYLCSHRAHAETSAMQHFRGWLRQAAHRPSLPGV